MAGRTTLVLDDPRNPELEGALARGEDVWPQFAAWLSDHGSPRGDAGLRELAIGAADPAADPVLSGLYWAIHRSSAAAQLGRERSWQFEWRFGFPARARFMLAATRRREPQAYVAERWIDGKVDPESVAAERRQLEHGLGLAELRFITELELVVGEFEEQLPRVARMLAARRWDHLQTLRLAVAHHDPAAMGAGAGQERAYVTGAETAAMLAALPNLRRLELVGHAMFPALAHAGLTELRLAGQMPVFDGGFLRSSEERADRGLLLPRLTRLELASSLPIPASTLHLDPSRLPALVELDLLDLQLEGGVLDALARSPILPQLRRVHVRSLEAVGPAFAHVEVVAG